jgi:hypothetical protein
MNRQTKIIAECEKQLSELERLYHSVESQIGLAVVNSFDAHETLPQESAADVEVFLKLQKEKDDYNRTAQELRERADRQKKGAVELTKIKRILKNSSARQYQMFEALGCALCAHYTPQFEVFLGESYENICLLKEQITQHEQTLNETALSSEAGLFEVIKATFDKTAKKTTLSAAKQKLSRAYTQAGSASFSSPELKKLFEGGKLTEQIQGAYKDALASQEEIDSLCEQEEEITIEMEEDANFVKDAPCAAGAGSGAAKIKELEKEINKAAVGERIILSRVGKRFIELNAKKTAAAAKRKKRDAAKEQNPFSKDIAPLMERARILQTDMASCKKNIEKAKREIEVTRMAKSITSLKNQTAAIEKKIAKLEAEKERAQEEIKSLSGKLASLRFEQ